MDSEQKTWWGRNWLWVVPVGGCLTLIILGIVLAGSLFFGISKAMKSTEPYQLALEKSLSNEELKDIIGSPIEPDGMMQGTMNYKNGQGDVDIRFPVRGPQGKATVEVKGEKDSEEWEYEHLRAIIEKTGDTLDLLDPDSNGF